MDGVTSFDVGTHSRDEIVWFLRQLRDNPETYLEMCAHAAARFREVVDFDEDADKIARLIGAGVPA
jgi:hypothetical protein